MEPVGLRMGPEGCSQSPLHTHYDDFETETYSDITESFDHEEIYQSYLLPIGDASRIEKIPALEGKDFAINGDNWWKASTDIQLSSLGWFSIMYGARDTAKIRVYTPGGLGIHMRQPSIHPNASVFRRKRIRNTVAFQKAKPLV